MGQRAVVDGRKPSKGPVAAGAVWETGRVKASALPGAGREAPLEHRRLQPSFLSLAVTDPWGGDGEGGYTDAFCGHTGFSGRRHVCTNADVPASIRPSAGL